MTFHYTGKTRVPAKQTYMAVLRSSDVATDLNITAGIAFPWTDAVDVESPFSHSTLTNPERITVDTDDLSRIEFTGVVSHNTGGQRNSIRVQVRKNGGQLLEGEGISYGRQAGGSNESSASISAFDPDPAANDFYEVVCTREGTAGTVQQRVANASVFIARGME